MRTTALSRAVLIAALALAVTTAIVWLRVQTAPLGAIVRGGQGPPTLVLMHGYGSNAEDWLQFETVIEVPPNGRLVFPQGPWRGPGGARGWWWLNIEGHIPEGQRFPDFSSANPGGIKVASRLVRALLERQPRPIVLGGFSQGAMLTGEIAFQTDQELAGIVLLGGTTVNESGWAEAFARRRNLPVFIAHGRNDGVLPFAVAERFQQRLREAGLDVTWVPFTGGHGIPREVLVEINAFLSRVLSRGLTPRARGRESERGQTPSLVATDLPWGSDPYNPVCANFGFLPSPSAWRLPVLYRRSNPSKSAMPHC